MGSEIVDAAAPRIALGRIGEVALIGVLTFLCSLPLITMAAAQAAALRALDPRHSGAPGLTGVYFSALRDRLGRGIKVQAIWLAAAVVAVVDLWFGLSAQPGTLPRVVFSLLGGAGVAFVAMIRPFLAARLADDEPGSGQPLGRLVRSALALAGISPWRTLLAFVLELLTLFSGLVALILLPFVGGLVLTIETRLLSGAQRRLEQVQRHHVALRSAMSATD